MVRIVLKDLYGSMKVLLFLLYELDKLYELDNL
jgi:hypothetical protein